MDLDSNKRLLSFTNYLQTLLDCMIIQSYSVMAAPQNTKPLATEPEDVEEEKQTSMPNKSKTPKRGFEVFAF